MALILIFIARLIRLCTPEVSSPPGVFRGVTEPVTAGLEHSPGDTAVTDGIGMPPAGPAVLHCAARVLTGVCCM